MGLAERIAFLDLAYRRFNARDIDALLGMMTADVEWPDVAGGAVLQGKDAIRPYWEAQFAVADPRVSPTRFVPAGDDIVAVVDQRILDLQGGSLMPPAVVFHRYTFRDGLVRRMVVFSDLDEAVATR